MKVRERVEAIKPGTVSSPWKGFEHVSGWGVFGAPFSSGHVLALRVFPQNDFAPYGTLWHRDPEGTWSIYYDGPRADTACPRYYGAAAQLVARCTLDLTWRGPSSLTVSSVRPALRWDIEIGRGPIFSMMSAVGERVPEPAWRSSLLHCAMEQVGRSVLRMGRIRMTGIMPNGQFGILTPRRLFPIVRSRAELDGVDLGETVRTSETPRIGDVPLSSRAVFAIGRAYFEIADHEEHARTKAELRGLREGK